MNIKQKYCGYITIVGQTNVGKSTLINKIIGKKISIVSRKKNTTQNNIIGIKTEKNYQSIYVDTPGVIFDQTNNKIKYKKNFFHKIVKSSNLIIFMIDRINWIENNQIIFNEIQKNTIPIIIIINKIDKLDDKTILLPFIKFLKKKNNFIEIIPMSIKKLKNIIFLKNIIQSYLPKKNHVYPKYYTTTNSEFFTVSEIIREQLISFLGDELPSIIKVKIESFQKKEKLTLYIKAVILVENIRQKKIVIGHHGEKIKKISIISRNKIEKEFFLKTHLFLWVKCTNS